MLIYPIVRENEKHASMKSHEKNLNPEVLKLKYLEPFISMLSENKISDLGHISLHTDTLFTNYSFKNEDLEAHYITMIKCLLRNVDQAALNTFYNAFNKSFLIPLLYYSHHSNVMIKNAARIGLMTIFQKCTGKAIEHITSVVVPEYVSYIIIHLKRNALDIQDFSENCDIAALKNASQCYEEELEYIDDILTLNNAIKKQIIFALVDDFVIPFIFHAIICTKEQKEHSLIFCKVGLYLLIKILEKITDIDMREVIISFILQEKILKQDFAEKQLKYGKDLIDSLKLMTAKNEFHVERLYISYISYIIQSNTRGNNNEKLIKFYSEFLSILINSLVFNKQFNYDTECIKSKLLLLILEPLTLENEILGNANWLKLQGWLSESLEILYMNIIKEFEHEDIQNLVSLIDEEYEKFIKNKRDIKRIFNDACYFLLENYANSSSQISGMHISLNNLFSIRYLCLKFKKEEERILPILKVKENIGKVVNIDDCVPCKKLIHTNIYDDKHFLKLTNRQILLIQGLEHGADSNGVIVFNSYYKDITWSKSMNKTMTIHETYRDDQFHFKEKQKPLYVLLKFHNLEDLHFIEELLTEGRNLQVQTIRRKLEDLLHM